MADYIPYSPSTIIAKAMFNFDAFGISNFILTGDIRVSVSDAFNYTDSLTSNIYADLYTLGSDETIWTSSDYVNIQEILNIYSNFANITFNWIGDFDNFPGGSDTTPNPEDVGQNDLSDINISWIYKTGLDWSGISGASSDDIFNYPGGAGDIFLNNYYLPFSLDLNTYARQILMHELGHSLGLSHPHLEYDSITETATLTSDYSLTKNLGFDQLGFAINSAEDMYKEYFTIMSYDDQAIYTNAHTPMILDVIALQQAYGEGEGTTGSGNDTILAGTLGYRTYFDTGGIDTIDLSLYSLFGGVYLNMGVNIEGASHLVGVSMNLYDATNTIIDGGNPENLRWFYGEYENASGSTLSDSIIGNGLNNQIYGDSGDDRLYGGDGFDTLAGGVGDDYIAGGMNGDSIDGGMGNDVLRGGKGRDDIHGSGGDDLLIGAKGNDSMNGGDGDDTLDGGDNNDTMFGDNGFDTLQGGDGNDYIAGGMNGDSIDGGMGNDVLRGGKGRDDIHGSGGDDFLIGAHGNDTLNGGDGNDSMEGGGEMDTFVFDTLPDGTTNHDTITDFDPVNDSIYLDDDIFTALGSVISPTTLAADQFYAGTAAHDSDDRIIYDQTTGNLYYDPSGDISDGDQILFATLTTMPDVDASDFIIVT